MAMRRALLQLQGGGGCFVFSGGTDTAAPEASTTAVASQAATDEATRSSTAWRPAG